MRQPRRLACDGFTTEKHSMMLSLQVPNTDNVMEQDIPLSGVTSQISSHDFQLVYPHHLVEYVTKP